MRDKYSREEIISEIIGGYIGITYNVFTKDEILSGSGEYDYLKGYGKRDRDELFGIAMRWFTSHSNSKGIFYGFEI